MRSGSKNTQFVLLANPENRRVALFQEALRAAGLPHARVIAWRDLLEGTASLAELIEPGACVRIDSPGEDFQVERLLLARGGAVEDELAGSVTFSHIPREEALALSDDHGLIRWPRQWFLGFREALREVRRQLSEAPPCRLLNDPADIEVMFDKPRCHALLEECGVPVPAALGPVACYEDLLAQMRERGWSRVFVKLAHGSSASGVVALQTGGVRQQAVTTAEIERTESGGLRLYNSLRLRTYTAPGDVADLIDELCRHHVHVEQWLPKARQNGKNFDLRVLIIAGQARHTVVRASATPLTNLHLLNARGDRDAVQARMGEEAWKQAMATCVRAADAFGSSLHAGVDLLVTPDYAGHAVLEVNAFGDLLPRLTDYGLSTYAAEIEAVLGGWKTGNERKANTCVTGAGTEAGAVL